MRLISAVSGVQLPAPPPFFRHGVYQGVERDWGADRSGRKRATHGSPAAPRPAAQAVALAGRRLRRATPCTATNLLFSITYRPFNPSSPDCYTVCYTGGGVGVAKLLVEATRVVF